MAARRGALLLALLLHASARRVTEVGHEEIDLDEPPSTRWVGFATRYHDDIISRCKGMGKMYQDALGDELVQRWISSAANLDADMQEEYRSIVKTVDHPEVTMECLVVTDMWQAVDSPTFGCTALLAAMPNGTVIHGRNIDYDSYEMIRRGTMAKNDTGLHPHNSSFVDVKIKKGGKPIAAMLITAGSLGTHTGMRLGSYSVNSNARLANNKMRDNLKASEGGGKNFPWVLRKMLETVPDFSTAVRTIEETDLNAPNYFIFAGAGPYEGAVVTKDRLGNHERTTPPTQWLSAANRTWHLVQTNDDLLSPPDDRRRDAALTRLATESQADVDMDFVQREMQAPLITNTDTLLTWVGNPSTSARRIIVRPSEEVIRGVLTKRWYRTYHVALPQDFAPKDDLPIVLAKPAQLSSERTVRLLRGSQ